AGGRRAAQSAGRAGGQAGATGAAGEARTAGDRRPMRMRDGALAVLLAVAGCGHTQSVESPESKAKAKEHAKETDTEKAAAPEKPATTGRAGEEIPVAR